MEHQTTYTHLAELFRYPSPEMNQQLLACQVMLNTDYPEQARMLLPFIEHFLSLSHDGKEELYTKTFDIQALCYLDLGYIIFGEDYKRGTFLMNMKTEQDQLGVNYLPELPDHLCHVLTLLDIHPDPFFTEELVAKILLPAVKKNIEEFDSAKVELKLKALQKKHNAIIQEEYYFGNIYQLAFKVLQQVLECDFGESINRYQPVEELPASLAFLNSCNTYTAGAACSLES